MGITPTFVSAFPVISKPAQSANRRKFSIQASVQTKPSLDLTASRAISSAAVDAIRKVYTQANAAIHHGTCAHQLGRDASDLMQESREKIARFINASDSAEIIITDSELSATDSFARSFCKTLRRGDEIILSAAEMDATRFIWSRISNHYNLTIHFIEIDAENGEIGFEDIVQLINSNTRLIVLEKASRILAACTPLEDVVEYAEALEIPLLLNCTASLPYQLLDVQQYRSTFVVASGDTIGAPGTAFLYGPLEHLQRMPPPYASDLTLSEYDFNTDFERENWADLPERFALGMPSLPAGAVLGATVEQYAKLLDDSFQQRAEQLAAHICESLNGISQVTLFGRDAPNRIPVACFTVDHVDLGAVTKELTDRGINVNHGTHGAAVAHNEVLEAAESIRVAFDPREHTIADIDSFAETLADVIQGLSA